MTWDIHSIKATFESAEELGASHVIISHTNVDFDQTFTLVYPGEDPRKVWEESNAKRNGYDIVDEVYRISLGWESQAKEHRARHWEFDPAEETKELQERSVDQIKAEALREAAEVFNARLADGTGNGRAYNSYTVARMLRERADTLDPPKHRVNKDPRAGEGPHFENGIWTT